MGHYPPRAPDSGHYPPRAPGTGHYPPPQHPPPSGRYTPTPGSGRFGPGSTQRIQGHRTPQVTPSWPYHQDGQTPGSGRHEQETQTGSSRHGPFDHSVDTVHDTVSPRPLHPSDHDPVSASSTWRSGRRFGRYMLMGELGRGGFGTVFLAHDPELGRDVAVKILTKGGDRALARFERETKAYARLRHPGIVSIHDSGTCEGRPFLVMEYVSGDTLEAMGGSERRLTVSRTVELVREAAQALHYAHTHGILHRDVKPANILVDQDGHARVLDFGLAFLKTDDERLSRTGVPLGTPAYMAPEQFQGQRVDGRADVYALGGTLFYCLTGESPLEQADSFFEAMRKSQAPSPQRLNRSVPDELDVICRRCMAKDPDDRYASAEEMANALTQFLAGPRHAPRRAPPAVVVLASIALGLVGIALGLWAFRREDDPVVSGGAVPETPVDAPLPTTTPLPADATAESREARETLARAHRLASDGSERDMGLVRELLDRAERLAGTDLRLREEIAAERGGLRARGALAQALALARNRVAHETVLARFDRALELAADVPGELKHEIALARCWHLFNRTRYEACAAAASPLVTLPGRPGLDARLIQAMSLILERTPESRAQGEELLKGLGDDDPEGVVGDIARASLAVHRDDDDYMEAERYARQALREEPEHSLALVQLGVALTNSGREGEALSILDRVSQELAPDMSRAHLGAALNMFQSRKYKPADALARIDLAMRLTAPKEDPLALQVRGQIQLGSGQFRAAEQDLLRAIGANPRSCPSWLMLGMVRDQLTSWEGAEEAFRRAFEIDATETTKILGTFLPLPVRYRAMRIVGLPVSSAELTQSQRELLSARTADTPTPAREDLREALEKSILGHPWESIAKPLERALQAAPESAPLALLAARIQMGRARYQDALSSLSRARAQGASAAQVGLLEGHVLWQSGRAADAMRRFESVFAADPEGALGLCARAIVRTASGDDAAGLEAAKQACALAPTDLDTLAAAAWVRQSASRLPAALEPANAALERYGLLDPWVASTRAGVLLAELFLVPGPKNHGQLSAAFLEVEKVLGATASASPRLTGLEYALFIPTGDPWYGSAKRWLWEVERSEPGRAEVPLFRGLFALRDREGRAAVLRHWREAFTRDPALHMPKPLLDAYEQEFGEGPDLDALRRGG